MLGWIRTWVLLASCTLAHAQDVTTVAAASDLQGALEEVVRSYAAGPGAKVRVTYGSSGNLLRQIEQGAPFDIFLSADEAYADELAARGMTAERGVLYALGRLVIYVPRNSTLHADPALADLAAALRDGRLKKFAIANPAHAPYGRAAREALTAAGLWTAIQPHLVLGENVSQAAQFAASGSTQGGIFALSLAQSPALAAAGTAVTLPAGLHAPLRQKMVLLKRAGPGARAFYAYLQAPRARTILQRHGFVLPGS